MKNVRFFELLVNFALGEPPERLFAADATATTLAECPIGEFVALLTEKFRRRVKLSESPPAPGRIARRGRPPGWKRPAARPDPASVAFYPDWNSFWTVLDRARPRSAAEGAELRILTTSFHNGAVPTPELMKLARAGMQIRIILLDPASPLVEARQKLRSVPGFWSPDDERKSIMSQIEMLRRMRKLLLDEGCSGSIDFATSSVMPHSFMALCSSFAVHGWFFADQSFMQGPMQLIEGPEHQSFLDYLTAEWEKRWNDAQGVRVCPATTADILCQADGG